MDGVKPSITIGSTTLEQGPQQDLRQLHEPIAGSSRQLLQPRVFSHLDSPDPLTHADQPIPSPHNPFRQQPRYWCQSSVNRVSLGPYPRQSSSTITENHGNCNQTNNGSYVSRDCRTAVFYVFPNESSILPQMEPMPHSTPIPILSDSQNSPPALGPSPTSSPSSQAEGTQGSLARQIDNRMPGQRYASLLSEIGPGYPLWMPSPRCTDTGEEHTVSIGDVGICSDVDPFHTLFNITQHLGGVTEGNRIPDGVDPPCDIRGSVTVAATYHRNDKLLLKPHNSLSQQATIDEDDLSKVFTFNLTEKEGALLLLPQGGILKKLQKTYEFRSRISRHWRQWYDFADEEGDPGERQLLCLLTGVEQCSAWAMGVWDPISGDSSDTLGSLVFTIDKSSGNGSWTRCPPRCSTQSLVPARADNELKEAIFVRALWITRIVGNHSAGAPAPSPSRDHDEGGDEHDVPTRHRWNSRNPFGPGPTNPSQSPFNPFRQTSSPARPPQDYHAYSVQSDVHQAARAGQLLENDATTIQLPATFDVVSHPCELINQLAFEIISKARPSLLDSGCAIFSHDDDWLSVREDFDDVNDPLKGTELLRRICVKFKFVAEGDTVYTECMTPTESEIIQQSMGAAQDHPRTVGVGTGNPSSIVIASSDFRVQYGRTYRNIADGDIVVRRHAFTEALWVSPKHEQDKSLDFEAMKVKKTVQIAGVFGAPGSFTAIKIKPVDGNESKAFMAVSLELEESSMIERLP
ncbi:hypothetical protein PQX77_017117 [Marasmius sp. AFHP31]|nr:hypothetical protein PQX77_017117 [Marasmius sp. AFHP31]